MSDHVALMHGDCLDLMKVLPDKSVDMILCDLPYGTTACKWDVVIPFDKLWEQYERVIKDNGAIVLFGGEPFSSRLRLSNLEIYKYDWVWKKNRATNVLNAKKQPLRQVENILIFNTNSYYPQGLVYKPEPSRNSSKDSEVYGTGTTKSYVQEFTNYPKNVLEFDVVQRTQHPTQKPVALLEYLIKTYTNANDLVLDNTMGSGSTGVACVNTNREFIGMEKDDKYFAIAKQRIADAEAALTLPKAA